MTLSEAVIGMATKPRSRGGELRPVVQAALGRAVARREVPDKVIDSIVKRLSDVHGRTPIAWIDVCVYGICIDHYVEPAQVPEVVNDIFKTRFPIRKLELFPWGIFDPDIVQIRVEHRFDELAPFIEGKSLGGH